MAAPASPIAIVGIGCVFPKAANRQALWSNLLAGVDAIGPVPPSHFNAADYLDTDPKAADRIYTARGGFIDPVDFPPLDFGITPNSLEATDPTQLLGLWVARAALHDAGYDGQRPFDRSRTSVILGVTGTLPLVIPLGARLGHPLWKQALSDAGVPTDQAQDVMRRVAHGYVGWQEESFPGLLGNVVAGRIANRLDLGGTNCVVDAACASSLSAVHLAMLELQAGRSDLVLTGGMDCFNDVFMFMCFSKTPALSPTGDARPFDAAGDGTILGEGLGCVVLKRLADAQRDHDQIYAVIRAVGTSSDGKGTAIYAPNPAGQARALRSAYAQAGISPRDVELVEAHGTGTKAGDLAELTALNEVYREGDGPAASMPWCALGSVKSQLGHTKAAAGMAGLIKAALALHHRVQPPTIKVRQPLEPLLQAGSPFHLNSRPRPWVRRDQPRRAAVSSFGFGGSNFHCVLEEHPASVPPIAWNPRIQVLPLSAPTPDGLRDRLNVLASSTDDWPRRCAAARAEFDPRADLRLVLVMDLDQDQPARKCADAERLLSEKADATRWSTPHGIYFGRGPAGGRLALLFPGQGSQYVGMMRDLACRFPAFTHWLEVGNEAAADLGTPRLSDRVYPPAAFSPELRSQQDEELRRTDATQPALAALSAACLEVLRSFGVEGEGFAGHSFGELVALHAAGCCDQATLLRLASSRGRLMAQFCQGDSGMTAVRADSALVRQLVADLRNTVHVANDNAPNQVVVAGPLLALVEFESRCAERGLAVTRLPVAAAFHTPSLEPARAEFGTALDAVLLRPPRKPVYANLTALPHAPAHVAIAEHLSRQLAEPIRFREMIERMRADGFTTFVEVGPSNKLTGLVQQIAPAGAVQAFAVDASSGKHDGLLDLARLLAQLAALGHAVDLRPWCPAEPSAPLAKSTLTVPISGALYRKPVAPLPPATSISSKPVASQPVSMKASVVPPDPSPVVSPSAVQVTKQMNATLTPPRAPGPMAQEVLLALQRVAEQTAQLHRQFLQGQERALEVFQQVLGGGVPSAVAPQTPLPLPAISAVVSTPPVVVPPPPALTPAALPETAPAALSTPSPNLAGTLREIIAAKTGYPAEMLELDMELDADLGIDSIKRVEIFAAFQERLPNAPAIKPEHLGRLRTLREVLNHLTESGPVGLSVPPAAPPATSTSNVLYTLLAIIAAKTGYPAEMLGLDMELDADLGIDSIKRVEIFAALQEQMPDAPPIKPEHLGGLRTLRQIAAFLEPTPSGKLGATSESVNPPRESAQVHEPPAPTDAATVLARYVPRPVPAPPLGPKLRISERAEWWILEDDDGLTAALAQTLRDKGFAVRLDTAERLRQIAPPSQLAGLIMAVDRRQCPETALPAAVQLLGHLQAVLQGGVVAGLTRLDGRFGWHDANAVTPWSAALAGLLKTAQHELTGIHAKVIDLPSNLAHRDEAAQALADELTHQGPLEVALDQGQRWTVSLAEEPVRAPQPTGGALGADDVVLITGGARGVTALCAQALARQTSAKLLILGRTPEPGPEPDWLRPLATAAEVQAALVRQPLVEGWTPKRLQQNVAQLMALRELRNNLAALRATGSHLHYEAVDVRDAVAVAAVLKRAQQELGPIRAVIHGAGVLADRRLTELSADDVQVVWSTKVNGLENILSALPTDGLRHLLLFSSTTARFGRAGQAAYAMANEALNKMACREAARRPACRVRAINWGPWDGGMVTEALKPLFRQEGIALIPLAAGAIHLLQELEASSGPEVVVLGGPLPASMLTPETPQVVLAEPTPLLRRSLSVAACPVLADHVLKGQAVVPAALLMDWLAQAALQRHPGLAFHGFNEFRVLKGITLGPDEERTLELHASAAERDNGSAKAQVRLATSVSGKRSSHASAEVLLATQLPAARTPAPCGPAKAFHLPIDQVYADWLFHGPALQAVRQLQVGGQYTLQARVRLAPPPRDWLTQPWRSQWICDPLAIDAGFQLAIVWTQWQRQMPCLPAGFGRYRQFVRHFPGGEADVRLEVASLDGAQLRARLTWLTPAGHLLAEMDEFTAILDAGLAAAFRLRELGLAAPSV